MKRKLLLGLSLFLFNNFSQAQISNANIIAHFKLDGNGSDSSGNEQHAEEFNISGATDRFGKENGACYFNGTNTYLKAPNSITVSPADSISICLWVNQEEKTKVGWSTLIDKRYAFTIDPYSSYGIATHPSYNNKWIFSVSSGTVGSGKSAMAKASNPYGTWTFVAATYNRSEMKIYINGALDTVVAKTGPIGYSNLSLYVGYAGTGPNEYFKGKLDDLRIYGRILSQSEILALYSAPNAINETLFNPKSIAVYPNPVKNSLRVDSDFTWKTASIFDIFGKNVWSGAYSSEINIDFLETGNYILKLTDENSTSINKRFIKE